MKKKVFWTSLTILLCVIVLDILFITLYEYFNNTKYVYSKNISRVVEIKVSDDEQSWGYATGCFIDRNGNILTNKHVAFNSSTNANYKKVQVRLYDAENWIDAEVIKVSDNEDLALIKINKKNASYFKMTSSISDGQPIFTIGNPNGFGLSFTSGVISSKLKKVVYDSKTIEAIQTSLVINEGNSGGPVFNKFGQLVGLISFRLKDKQGDVIQGVSFAIPVLKISEFLSK